MLGQYRHRPFTCSITSYKNGNGHRLIYQYLPNLIIINYHKFICKILEKKRSFMSFSLSKTLL